MHRVGVAERSADVEDLHGDREVTIGSIAVNALLTPYEDERNLSGDDKVKRFRLAQSIHDAVGEIEVTVEQVALLKSLIAKAYTPLIVGQAWVMTNAGSSLVAYAPPNDGGLYIFSATAGSAVTNATLSGKFITLEHTYFV